MLKYIFIILEFILLSSSICVLKFTFTRLSKNMREQSYSDWEDWGLEEQRLTFCFFRSINLHNLPSFFRALASFSLFHVLTLTRNLIWGQSVLMFHLRRFWAGTVSQCLWMLWSITGREIKLCFSNTIPHYHRVSNPTMATNNVEDYRHSTHLLAATTLR